MTETTTLAEYGAKHLPAILAQVSESTATSYEIAWRKRVLPTLGDYPLGELSPLVIEDAYFSWDGTRSTKADARAILSRVLNRAVRDRILWTNPTRQLELPRQKSQPRDSYALTDTELSKFFELIPERYHLLFALQAYGGLRFSEASAVRVGSVEWDKRLLMVNAQLSKNGAKLVPTKSGRPRYVPILADLARHLEDVNFDADPRTFLTTSPTGRPIHPSNLARELDWRNLRDLIRPGMRWHDLRHHCATTWLDMGIPAHDVKEFMGHSSLSVTDLYTTAGKNAAARAVDRFESSTI